MPCENMNVFSEKEFAKNSGTLEQVREVGESLCIINKTGVPENDSCNFFIPADAAVFSSNKSMTMIQNRLQISLAFFDLI